MEAVETMSRLRPTTQYAAFSVSPTVFPGLPTGRRDDEPTSTLPALYRAGRQRVSTRQCPLSGSCCCKGCCIWCSSRCLGAADKGYRPSSENGENHIFPFSYERQRRFLQGTGGGIYPRVHVVMLITVSRDTHLLAQRVTQQEASGTKGIAFVHLG